MKRQKLPPLEVRRMYEPNRLAVSVLEEAYRQLIPIIQRTTNSRPVTAPQERPQPHRRQGGTHP